MTQKTTKNIPAPEDIFSSESEISSKSQRATNKGSISHADAKAIPYNDADEILSSAIEYISETKEDVVGAINVKQLLKQLKQAQTQLRKVQVKYYDESPDWQDSTGRQDRLFLREQDPIAFDQLLAIYESATDAFNTYFEEHIASF